MNLEKGTPIRLKKEYKHADVYRDGEIHCLAYKTEYMKCYWAIFPANQTKKHLAQHGKVDHCFMVFDNEFMVK